MKASTWVVSLLCALPSLVQASIISIEYSGKVTWNSEANRPSDELFTGNIGDRVSGFVRIDLSRARDNLPEADRADYRAIQGDQGFVVSNYVSHDNHGRRDAVLVWDNIILDGQLVDRITINNVSDVTEEIQWGTYRRESTDFGLSLILPNDWLADDRLDKLGSDEALPLLGGSAGSVSVTGMIWADGSGQAAWGDGFGFSVDSIKITQTHVDVPEPAPLIPLLMGTLFMAYHRRKRSAL